MQLLLDATLINAKGQELSQQAIVIHQGIIQWCGDESQLPRHYKEHAKNIHDCTGRIVTPGLIDCHTHLVYAGHRASEFQLKLEGKTYAEIAKSGGGILSTVRQTRDVSEDELFIQSLPRIQALAREGVTTVEIKSGYGLDLANEIKMLRVAKQLGEYTGLRVRTTFLGAHAVPPEYQGKSQAYVDYVCFDMMPAVSQMGLADAVDVFCEDIGFSLDQAEQIFSTARALNLPVKCHAEQLSCIGATELAAQWGALSCDHLEFLDEKGASALAKAQTVAVLLPGAFYFLRQKTKPPVDLLRQKGAAIALATDCNPGSSPSTSLLLMMNMACLMFSLSIPEALAAVTSNAAKALGIQNQVGQLAEGYFADLILWDTTDSATLCYYVASPIPHRTMIGGRWAS